MTPVSEPYKQHRLSANTYKGKRCNVFDQLGILSPVRRNDLHLGRAAAITDPFGLAHRAFQRTRGMHDHTGRHPDI